MSSKKVAIVTGSAGSLGSATVRALRASGVEVIGVDVTPSNETDIIADMASSAGNSSTVDEAVSRHGRLDILVLNAGIQHVAPIGEFPETEWDRLHALMCKGPFLAIRAAWQHLVARPGARIVVVASTNAIAAEPNKVGYNAAKSGVVGVVRTAALEGARHRLTANAVAPGWMRTPLVERQIVARSEAEGRDTEEIAADLLSRMPGQRFIEPDEVAGVIAFLSSAAASGVSGALVPVDGGLLAW